MSTEDQFRELIQFITEYCGCVNSEGLYPYEVQFLSDAFNEAVELLSAICRLTNAGVIAT